MAIFAPAITAPTSGSSFDATNSFTIEWSTSTTDLEKQASFQIVIRDLSDNSVAYDSSIQSGDDQEFTLPASTLSNGNSYSMRITVTGDSGGGTKTNNRATVFYTSTQATLTVAGIVSPTSQFISPTATYNQAQNVILREYEWFLLDNNDVVLQQSGSLTGEPITFDFVGLENNTTFKVRVDGTTQEGNSITSNVVSFTTGYTIPDDVPEIIVTSNRVSGLATLNWSNIIQIIPELNGSVSYVTGVYDQGVVLNGCLNYNLSQVNIPEGFALLTYVTVPSGFSGNLIRFIDNGEIRFEIGYDSSISRFYYSKGQRITAEPFARSSLISGYYVMRITSSQVEIYDGTATVTFN